MLNMFVGWTDFDLFGGIKYEIQTLVSTQGLWNGFSFQILNIYDYNPKQT